MNLNLETTLSVGYKSGSQIARVLTEGWVLSSAYCPACGNDKLNQSANNAPVSDFYCPTCGNTFELKSKNGVITKSVAAGSYRTMIERINSDANPDFFFMSYSHEKGIVTDFIVVPKAFVVDGTIQKRKPLAATARRAGWIGCNIIVSSVPVEGRIFIVQRGNIIPKQVVVERYRRVAFIKKAPIKSRAWLVDVLGCIDELGKNEFTLAEMYSFEGTLSERHHENNHVRDKIRQQLQVLRNRGLIEFLSNGKYRRVATVVHESTH